MTAKDPDAEQTEYTVHEDKRHRQKQRLLTAPYYEPHFPDSLEPHGKHHQPAVQYRISPFAEKVGEEVAALFGMSLSQYAKAVLYRDLGLVFETIDRRKRKH
jgi:hypothetical protein